MRLRSLGVGDPCSRPSALFALVAGIVVCSRLPFLRPGYGADADAWRVARVAHAMAATRDYEASRLPGYPVQEIGSALPAWAGPVGLNGATAVMSAAAAGHA